MWKSVKQNLERIIKQLYIHNMEFMYGPPRMWENNLKQKIKQMNTTNQNNGENTSQNKQLVKRQNLEGSPFQLIDREKENGEHEYFIAMGKHRITEPTKTEEQTMEKFVTESWNISATIMSIIAEETMHMIQEEQAKRIEESINKRINIKP